MHSLEIRMTSNIKQQFQIVLEKLPKKKIPELATALKNNKLKPLLHGEAIVIGMVLEAYLANKVSGLSAKELEEIKVSFKSKFDLIEFNKEQINSINELLIHDKKNSHGNINFTLIKRIGKYVIDQQADEKLIIQAFDYYLE